MIFFSHFKHQLIWSPFVWLNDHYTLESIEPKHLYSYVR